MTLAPQPSDADTETGSGYGRAGDRVTVALRAMIANGRLVPGEHLRQDELARQLGSTRVPVREAFKTLAAEGILAHRPNHGHFVTKLTSSELAQICWLRDACENRLARTVTWPDEDVVDDLRARNDAMRELTARAAFEIVEADRHFHERFWALSPMRIVTHEAARMWSLITPYRSFMDYGSAVVTRMHAEHETIVAAIAARDLDAYAGAVEAHQRHIYDVVDEMADRELREPAS